MEDASALILRKEEGLYLFGFARPPIAEILCTCDEEQIKIYMLGFKDIGAICRKVLLADFCGVAAEKNLQNIQWVGPRACMHEHVLEQIMLHSPVFPARFGTIFSNPEKLMEFLARHYPTIVQFFQESATKQEWAVKGFLETKTAESRLLGERLAQIGSNPGKRYLLEQRLRGEIGKELKNWLQNVGNDITAHLQPWIVQKSNRKTLPREASGRELDMVFNWALLLERESSDRVVAEIRNCNEQYHPQGLVLEIKGPWPPYSFCPALEG